mmetsp:Transcript_25047/g.63177  ORF Transcript_25047/g.63177 Transcript_25047/m.63177 type:complete len:265 (-) Transcript_25047:1019-1813(-)
MIMLVASWRARDTLLSFAPSSRRRSEVASGARRMFVLNPWNTGITLEIFWAIAAPREVSVRWFRPAREQNFVVLGYRSGGCRLIQKSQAWNNRKPAGADKGPEPILHQRYRPGRLISLDGGRFVDEPTPCSACIANHYLPPWAPCGGAGCRRRRMKTRSWGSSSVLGGGFVATYGSFHNLCSCARRYRPRGITSPRNVSSRASSPYVRPMSDAGTLICRRMAPPGRPSSPLSSVRMSTMTPLLKKHSHVKVSMLAGTVTRPEAK